MLGVAVAGINLIIAFALVTVSVLLVVVAALVAWLFDRNEFRPIGCRSTPIQQAPRLQCTG
jgi:hypothetical protein